MAKATNKKAAATKAAVPAKKAAATSSAPKKAAAVQNLKKANAVKKAAASGRRSGGGAEDTTLLQQLFVDSLKDIYWAEKALLKALGKMAKSSTAEDLRSAFEEHQTQTEEQIQRLEQVFEHIGQKAQAKKCEAMAGLIKEAEEMISSTKKGTETRDVALIMASQKAEHYEIATYGSLATLAAQLGYSEAQELLGTTLQEEKDTDALLTELAEGHINQEAEDEDSEDGEEEEDEAGEGDDAAEEETED